MGLVRGVVKSPYKLTIYGKAGIGKSSLAALAEESLLLNIEDGIDRIDAVKTEKLKNWTEIFNRDEKNLGILNELCREGSYEGYAPKTIVIDTTTSLEKILDPVATAEFNRTNDKAYDNLEQIPYGKGAGQLQMMMSLVLDVTDALKNKGISTIFVGHETIEKIQNPAGDDYDQYNLQSMHKKVREVIINRSDAVLYATMEGTVVTKDKGFGNKKHINMESGNRILKCLGGTGYVAKNRFNFPKELPMTAEMFNKIHAESKKKED